MPTVDEVRELTGEKTFHCPFTHARVVRELIPLSCPIIRREAQRKHISDSNWTCIVLPKEDQQAAYVL